MTDKFAEFMIAAAWDAVKASYESRDLEMLEAACRHIRSFTPIDDDPTPVPIPDDRKFANINHAISVLGLDRGQLMQTLRDYIAKFPTGKSINRKQICPVLENVFPICKGILIGDSQQEFSMAFVRAVTNNRKTEELAFLGLLNGPDGDLIVKCSPQNVEQFTGNGYNPPELLSLLPTV